MAPMVTSITTNELAHRYGIPSGYRRISWDAVHNGQYVFIYGTTRVGEGSDKYSGLIEAKAYGPHKVIDREGRILANDKHKRFREYDESLLIVDEPISEPSFERWVENSRECERAVEAMTKGDVESAMIYLADAEVYADDSDHEERDTAFRQAVAYVEYMRGMSYAKLKRQFHIGDDPGRDGCEDD